MSDSLRVELASDVDSDEMFGEQQHSNEGRPESLNLSPVYAPSETAEETRSAGNASERRETDDEDVFSALDIGPSSNVGEIFNERLNLAIMRMSCGNAANGKRDAAPASNAAVFEPLEKFEEAPPLELPTKTRLKMKIKRLNITGEWRWKDGNGDNCGICRAPFEGCCVDCKMPGDECPLVLGICKHPFHMHCIVKWTNAQGNQPRPACPLCRQEWKFAS